LFFVQGLFSDTAEKLVSEVGDFSLVHIDCDIKSAVEESYEVVKNNMVQGGYVVFDDALYSSCLGATEVIENTLIRRDGLNSEQIFPHYVFRFFRKEQS
jgi:predicted O-methyltransferase YrrM